MGAWGDGLFQSDRDLDEVDDLDHEAGLDELQEEAEARGDKDALITLYNPSDPALVREHLQSNGKLDEMVAKYTAQAVAWLKKSSWGQPSYTLCLMGACFMMLGCELNDEFLDTLRDHFTEAGFMPEALQQLDKALNEPNGFKSGEPYDLDSPGLLETVNLLADAEESETSGGFQGMNVAAPFGLSEGPDTSTTVESIKAKIEAKRMKEGIDKCGGCGSEDAALSCSRCKQREYCDRHCQKNHWKIHKLACCQ